MRTRIPVSVLAGALLLLGAPVLELYPDERTGKSDVPRERVYDPATLAAIERGLAYLARTQTETGAWENGIGYKLNLKYEKTGFGPHVGVTALGGMAFLANGHTPDRGKYSRQVRKALEYVLSCVNADSGYISANHTRMYSHAFAALFLTESYGMSGREDVKEKLRAVVDLLVHCQNREGGWRYQPFAEDADISLTVCQLQFLRAARNCGLSVPTTTIERAIQYVRKCRVEASSGRGWGGPVGAFKYQADESMGTRYTFALTAAGLTALNAAGVYDDPIIRHGLEYLVRERPSRSKESFGYEDFHYFYGHYYAIQAFYQAGGRYWEDWWKSVQSDLVDSQVADGSWTDEVGPAYATAMATLILSVPLEYLPIFQR
jgi:hypothetical protein